MTGKTTILMDGGALAERHMDAARMALETEYDCPPDAAEGECAQCWEGAQRIARLALEHCGPLIAADALASANIRFCTFCNAITADDECDCTMSGEDAMQNLVDIGEEFDRRRAETATKARRAALEEAAAVFDAKMMESEDQMHAYRRRAIDWMADRFEKAARNASANAKHIRVLIDKPEDARNG